MSQQYAICRMKTDEAEPVFVGTEKEVKTEWKQYTGRPALLDFFIASDEDKNLELRMRCVAQLKKIARKNIEKICKKELEEEPREENLGEYYYRPNRFVIRHKATGGLRYIAGDRNDIVFEWNEHYANRPYSSDYFVEIDHKSIDYSYHHKLPKNKNLEVTVTKCGNVKFLDGSYV